MNSDMFPSPGAPAERVSPGTLELETLHYVVVDLISSTSPRVRCSPSHHHIGWVDEVSWPGGGRGGRPIGQEEGRWGGVR